ncbi:TetR/AcrR family transcriptional regulator [Lipingzhangella sp. LS1_29]|uniref:TetR/AcrR family transcriptional regulator n=1 Tax=Lipingzhangella rawalii TaxID=2055835 RepID=A0ABU2H2K7_9ACTN|nr:TetR/AcrR family transcriptional regulator [Lipingzhangella rawalii]MDS1269528.1 TetR/AcrR family transcriptional regulator [Lipingzhangella rawalii]
MNTEPTRAPGRPRSPEADTAILRAALELLGEHKHVAAVSVEAVASRAGVGKATIYRRWSGKEELFTEAVATLRSPLPEVGQGASVRDDLVAVFTVVCGDLQSPLEQGVRLLMMSETHPEIAARIRRDVFAPRNEVVYQALRAGIARGELRADLDLTTVLNLLVGGAFVSSRSDTGQSPRQRAELLVDTVCDGLRAHG